MSSSVLSEIDSAREAGEPLEALRLCFEELSENPGHFSVRLMLARLFHEFGWGSFAVREVEQLLSDIPNSRSIRRLLEALAPESELLRKGGRESRPEATVAETDFEIDDLDLMEEDDA